MEALVLVKATKGQVLDLSKTIPGTHMFQVGLGWNVNSDSSMRDDIDIDVFAIKSNLDGKGAKTNDVFYYNNIDGKGTNNGSAYSGMSSNEKIFAKAKEIASTSVVAITKDNLTGEGDGDDETLFVNDKLLADGEKITIAVNIYQAETRRQKFGMVSGAYVTLYDETGSAAITFDLGEDYSVETGVLVAEIYRKDGIVKFKAIGKGFTGNINDLMTQFK